MLIKTTRRSIGAVTLGIALLLTACSDSDDTARMDSSAPIDDPSTFVEQTVGVEPVREIDSPTITKTSDPASVDNYVSYNGDWFNVQVKDIASVIYENEDTGNGTGNSSWSWGKDTYVVTLTKGPAANYATGDNDAAKTFVNNALISLDGAAVEEGSVQAGKLQGWDLPGYYVTQVTPEVARYTTFVFSNADTFVRYDVTTSPDDNPLENMQTLDLTLEN